MRRCVRTCAVALLALAAAAVASAGAQQTSLPPDSALGRALQLEATGQMREAATLYRRALAGTEPAAALLGLERAYVDLGWTDSLLVTVDSLIATRPRDETAHLVQLRTLQSLAREADARAAFERWTHDVPGNPAPYRQYADLLLAAGRTAAADSVVQRARQALGSTSALSTEVAQLRAAGGHWVAAAEAWRPALVQQPYMAQAAAYALAPASGAARDSVRAILLASPVDPAARLVLAGLEASWGSPAAGWRALRDLPVDSASAEAWIEFGTRAEGEERWSQARDAFAAALRWRPDADLALRAATAALSAGDAASVFTLAPLPAGDSSSVARTLVPLHVRALAQLGRAADAEQLLRRYDRFLPPGLHDDLTRAVAFGWVRAGDLTRGRAALTAAGADMDSSSAAGWLALYEGRLSTARALLRVSSEGQGATSDLALALAVLARVPRDSAPDVGQAFLMLARHDSAGAAHAFERAAASVPDAASLLLATAAQLDAATGQADRALLIWPRIVTAYADSPEAPAAELEWARALLARGNREAARQRLEHLVLTYPQSALLPQARRELDQLRGAPAGS